MSIESQGVMAACCGSMLPQHIDGVGVAALLSLERFIFIFSPSASARKISAFSPSRPHAFSPPQPQRALRPP
jgi:hypothetical protein